MNYFNLLFRHPAHYVFMSNLSTSTWFYHTSFHFIGNFLCNFCYNAHR